MGCFISPLLFVFIMETILRFAEVNTNKITDLSIKAFMDDLTLVAESESHMEQLVTLIQELFKWATMKIKPSKYRSLSIIKGNCRKIKFVDGNKIHTFCEKGVYEIGRYYYLPLTDRHHWQDRRKLMKDGLRSIDKCDLLNKSIVQCIF